MNYIIYDLEFNQAFDKNNKNSTLPFEIIQIGALKVNEDFEIVDSFNRLIKPTLYKEIHPYVENLTGITTNMLNKNNSFPKVYRDFLKFIGKEPFVSCVWGVCDIRELIKNIQYHDLNMVDDFKRYIDVQTVVCKLLKCQKGIKIGLKDAVEHFRIPIESEFHDALNDAYYTTQVFQKLRSKNLKPAIYNPPANRNSLVKAKVDNEKLMKQFEKMFGRPMTPEEKTIIKIAYNMGKTHQFLKPIEN